MEDSSLNNLLDCNVPVRIKPTGLSMHPFIRRDDYLTITPLSFYNSEGAGSLIAVGDCVIFQDSPERWLIHRVIGRNRENRNIIAKGDALLAADRPVIPGMIRGKVTGIHRVASKKKYRLDQPLPRRICRLIAMFSRGEAVISSFFRLRRREVEYSPGLEFINRIIKFPKWILTRVFFP